MLQDGDYEAWFDRVCVLWEPPQHEDFPIAGNGNNRETSIDKFRSFLGKKENLKGVIEAYSSVLLESDLATDAGLNDDDRECLSRFRAYISDSNLEQTLRAFLETWCRTHKQSSSQIKIRGEGDSLIECDPAVADGLKNHFSKLMSRETIRVAVKSALGCRIGRHAGEENNPPLANDLAPVSQTRSSIVDNPAAGVEIELHEPPRGTDQNENQSAASVASAPPSGKWTWLRPAQNLPAPRKGRWEKAIDGFGRAQDGGDGLKYRGAVARGRGHKQDALFCDDSFELSEAGPWKVLAVSDGAGSAVFSRVGSELAVEAACRTLVAELTDLEEIDDFRECDLQEIQQKPEAYDRIHPIIRAFERSFQCAAESITSWVDQKNSASPEPSPERVFIDSVFRGTPKEAARITPEHPDEALRIAESDCNCTLLLVAYRVANLVKSDGTKHQMGMVVSCAIGDGMIALFRRPTRPPHAILLMAPDTGAFAGQTQFLSRAAVQSESFRARVSVRFAGGHSDVVALVAMTDGVADDYYEGESGMERLFCDLMANGILPVAPLDAIAPEEIAREEEWANATLTKRAGNAAEKLREGSANDDLTSTPDSLTLSKHERALLERQASERSLDSLAVIESVFGPNETVDAVKRRTLKYTSVYGTALGLTPREMLERPALIAAIARSGGPSTSYSINTGSLPLQSVSCVGERLFTWLDTYLVKGSFDDRCLVVLQNGVVK